MASLRECFSSSRHHLYCLCLLFLTLLPLVSFPEVLKSLAVINVNLDSSLNSQENISNLESLNQVFRVKTVAWIGLFCSVLFLTFFFFPLNSLSVLFFMQFSDLDALEVFCFFV